MTEKMLIQTEEKRLAAVDLVKSWLDHERLRGSSENTLKVYEKGIEVYLDWLEERGGIDGQPTPTHIRQFKADLLGEYSPHTVNVRLTAVRSFYRWLVNTERIMVNPASEVRGVKRTNSRKHKRDALTSGEVRAVLETCGDGPQGIRDRAIISLMAYCGLRTVEIRRADLGHLQTQDDRLILNVQGKGHVEADDFVVIPRVIERDIMSWVSYLKSNLHDDQGQPLFVSLSNRNHGDRLSTRAIRGMVKDRFDRAGVVGGNKTTHSLRHSAITTAIKNGAKPLQVQAMARHASFDTTLGYIHEVGRLEEPAEDLISYE